MGPQASFAPKIASGVSEIDQTWGGLYAGGVYLVFGRNASGRNHVAHLFLRLGNERGEKAALISPARRKDLDIQAASIGFDLESAASDGDLKVLRLPGPGEWEPGDDGVLDGALESLSRQIIDIQAERVAIMDFTVLGQYQSFDRLRTGFVSLLRSIESVRSTILFTLPEPGNDHARQILDFLSTWMTGVVRTSLVQTDSSTSRRQLSLIPEIGHITRRADRLWNLEEIVAAADRIAIAPEIPVTAATAGPERADSREEDPTGVPTDRNDDEADSGSKSVPVAAVETVRAAPAGPSVGAATPDATVSAHEPPNRASLSEQSAGRVLEDRPAFTDELQTHLDAYSEAGSSFLVVAMRMDSHDSQSEPVDFEFMIDVVRACLKDSDSVFADLVNERLVILLEDRRAEDAQLFFGQLRETLKTEAPHHADRLLHAVSAIVVPNGTPFASAVEFLHYVLDDAGSAT